MTPDTKHGARFDSTRRAMYVGAFRAGATTEMAAEIVGVSTRTVARWLARGRKESTGPRADFAAAIDEASNATAAGDHKPMSEEELQDVVWRSATRGSVAAMKLAWEILKAQRNRDPVDTYTDADADPFAELDREVV